MTRERTLIAPVKQQVEKKKRARDSALSVKMYGTSVVRQPRVDTNVNCRDLQPCGDIYSSDFTPRTMVSRRKILSRSRDELHSDIYFMNEDDDEDIWYSKEKLYRVGIALFSFHYVQSVKLSSPFSILSNKYICWLKS